MIKNLIATLVWFSHAFVCLARENIEYIWLLELSKGIEIRMRIVDIFMFDY